MGCSARVRVRSGKARGGNGEGVRRSACARLLLLPLFLSFSSPCSFSPLFNPSLPSWLRVAACSSTRRSPETAPPRLSAGAAPAPGREGCCRGARTSRAAVGGFIQARAAALKQHPSAWALGLPPRLGARAAARGQDLQGCGWRPCSSTRRSPETAPQRLGAGAAPAPRRQGCCQGTRTSRAAVGGFVQARVAALKQHPSIESWGCPRAEAPGLLPGDKRGAAGRGEGGGGEKGGLALALQRCLARVRGLHLRAHGGNGVFTRDEMGGPVILRPLVCP